MHVWKTKEVTKFEVKVEPGQRWRKKGTSVEAGMYGVESVSNGRVYTIRLEDNKPVSFCIMNFRRHWTLM